MRNIVSKNKLSIIFYYLAYTFLIIETMLSRINFINNNKFIFLILEILFLGLSFLFGIDMNHKFIRTKKLIFYLLSLFVGISSYLVTNNSIFIFILLFIYCSGVINFENFIKYDMKIKIFMLIIIAIFLQIGLLDNLFLVRDNGLIRNTMGFYSPNTLGIYLLNICCDFVFINKNKITLKHYLFIIFCIIINYIITNSRTSSICLIILILFLICRKKMRLDKLYLVPYIFLIISFVLIYLYSLKLPFAVHLNSLLSDRLLCGLNFFEEYGITLFGNKFRIVNEWIGFVYVVDNAYLNIFINHGIILSIVSFLFLDRYCRNIRNSNVCIKIILFIYLISGMLESNLFNVIYNPYLIYMGLILIMDDKKGEVF